MLTSEQIDRLFDFCKRHHVHHYDVQTELVDHLANAIEEKMTADKNLSFETALNSVHAGFGMLGFAGIVNSHTKSLSNHYRKMRSRIFRSYFTWPKAALMICIFNVFIFLRQMLTVHEFSYVATGVVIFLWLLELFLVTVSCTLQNKGSKKLLMMQTSAEEPFFIGIIGGSFLVLFDWTDTFAFYMAANTFWFCIVTIIIILFFVGTLAYRQVVMEAYRSAKKQYPEIFEVA